MQLQTSKHIYSYVEKDYLPPRLIENVPFYWRNAPLNTQDAAWYMQMSVRRVQQLVSSGEIPALKMSSGTYLMKPKDVAAYMKKKGIKAGIQDCGAYEQKRKQKAKERAELKAKQK